jgi:hypothetical protein
MEDGLRRSLGEPRGARQQSKAKQSKAKQSKAKQSKAKQSKTKQSLGEPRGARQQVGRARVWAVQVRGGGASASESRAETRRQGRGAGPQRSMRGCWEGDAQRHAGGSQRGAACARGASGWACQGLRRRCDRVAWARGARRAGGGGGRGGGAGRHAPPSRAGRAAVGGEAPHAAATSCCRCGLSWPCMRAGPRTPAAPRAGPPEMTRVCS